MYDSNVGDEGRVGWDMSGLLLWRQGMRTNVVTNDVVVVGSMNATMAHAKVILLPSNFNKE